MVRALRRTVQPNATVTESKLLRDHITAQLREVDVVVETRVGPYPHPAVRTPAVGGSNGLKDAVKSRRRPGLRLRPSSTRGQERARRRVSPTPGRRRSTRPRRPLLSSTNPTHRSPIHRGAEHMSAARCPPRLCGECYGTEGFRLPSTSYISTGPYFFRASISCLPSPTAMTCK